ncbi:MAG: hypothetical protein ACRDLB_02090 [Actinomycetota bacterium]
MIPNVIGVVGTGCASVAVAALFAIGSGGLHPRYLAMAFIGGAVIGGFFILRYGSAGEVWRRLREPPG